MRLKRRNYLKNAIDNGLLESIKKYFEKFKNFNF